MAKKSFFKKNLLIKRFLRFFATFFSLVIFVLALYNLFFLNRIFPGIWVAGIYVGGKTPQEASSYIQKQTTLPQKVILIHKNQNFNINLASIETNYNFADSAKAAYDFDRTGNFMYDFYQRFNAPFRQENLGLRLKFNQEKFDKALSVIVGQVASDPVPPTVKFVGGEIGVDTGKAGQEVDLQKLKIDIGQKLSYLDKTEILIPIKTVDPTLSPEEERILIKRAENLIGKTLTLNLEFENFSYKNNSLFIFLGPKGGPNEDAVENEVKSVAKDVERSPQNPVFNFVGGRVSEFAPAKDGIKIRAEDFRKKFLDSLSTLENSEDEKEISFEIPVDRMPPEIKTSDVNNLGIKELIGRGVSRFAGSISSRIYNISLATSRINGVLVKPGDTFSFNNALGDVSKFTGYQEAYIIKDGKTVLGDGGGVCQVSTTLFRATLNAGLPIVERVAHAYRVGYYEQDSLPGFDATVYSPSPDLKFKNDTPGYILIQATPNIRNTTLVFELYGTNDGRVATTTKPIITDQVAPPDDLYQDDPTLPLGKIKQIDFKAWGAKVAFDYRVARDGTTIYQRTFVSNYHPWQAVFLRGTGPVQ